jgi:large subunit ribosomal protein L31e
MVDEKKVKAKKKDTLGEVVLERIYNVPLRREWLKVPKYKRAKKAVTALKQFIEKHMKSEDIKVGRFANLLIWQNGIKNPPHHIKIVAKKFAKGQVQVELETVPKRQKVPSVLKKAREKFAKKEKSKKETIKKEDQAKKSDDQQKTKEEKTDSKEVKKQEAKTVEKKESNIKQEEKPTDKK